MLRSAASAGRAAAVSHTVAKQLSATAVLLYSVETCTVRSMEVGHGIPNHEHNGLTVDETRPTKLNLVQCTVMVTIGIQINGN